MNIFDIGNCKSLCYTHQQTLTRTLSSTRLPHWRGIFEISPRKKLEKYLMTHLKSGKLNACFKISVKKCMWLNKKKKNNFKSRKKRTLSGLFQFVTRLDAVHFDFDFVQ
jgi:hypothetical protein